MKVLIYKHLNDLKPVGGSNGYCFNIYSELKRRDYSDIEFLSDRKEDKYKSNTLKKYLSTFSTFLRGNKPIENKDKYDVIHFHSSKDFYACRKSLKRYKGKIIFTMHSPVPYHLEIIENIKNYHKFLGIFLRKHAFSLIDRYCFNHADYILLPCKEAEESYYKNWKKYEKIHKHNESKYRYIPTGINLAKEKVDYTEYRKQLGYSDKDFIVAFVGRHNEVKGYDKLIRICELVNNKKIKFLIGGAEKPLSAPKCNNWKEIGWTDDPYSLINAANIFILPNKETYFDIVLLEALSLGKTCLISKTGGNKFILNQNCPGVYGFTSEEEAKRIIDDLCNKQICYKKNEEIVNFFKSNYSIEIFVDKYLALVKEITRK